ILTIGAQTRAVLSDEFDRLAQRKKSLNGFEDGAVHELVIFQRVLGKGRVAGRHQKGKGKIPDMKDDPPARRPAGQVERVKRRFLEVEMPFGADKVTKCCGWASPLI